MANTNQAFRQHEITRALRAAQAAGVKDNHVKIHLSNGTVLHVSGGGEVPTAPPKNSTPLRATLAKGGETSMAGKGDRTTTAPTDAAGKQQPGSTAHKTSSRGSALAEGGKGQGQHMFPKQGAQQAKAGQTGKPVSDSKQASGGLSRPARPGECGT